MHRFAVMALALTWPAPALSNGAGEIKPLCSCACVSLSGVEGDARSVTLDSFQLWDQQRQKCPDFDGRLCALDDPVLGVFGFGRSEQCGELKAQPIGKQHIE